MDELWPKSWPQAKYARKKNRWQHKCTFRRKTEQDWQEKRQKGGENSTKSWEQAMPGILADRGQLLLKSLAENVRNTRRMSNFIPNKRQRDKSSWCRRPLAKSRNKKNKIKKKRETNDISGIFCPNKMFLFPSEHAKNKAAILSICLNSKNAIQLAGQAKKKCKKCSQKFSCKFHYS